ncbi:MULTISPECIES: hypothetical protein [unclassified Streptomyces]|uniref:hypothetical protein n=1 Tax=unclassified Streptomyces TaxID=2593676 RepID=UPI002E1574E3|nr:hypothetical protein OG243_00035 [Streptomyces sp. NBC_01318]WSJ55941.1 hypothetical protein OG243_44505 [Streptomyces sp. NBC_01318]
MQVAVQDVHAVSEGLEPNACPDVGKLGGSLAVLGFGQVAAVGRAGFAGNRDAALQAADSRARQHRAQAEAAPRQFQNDPVHDQQVTDRMRECLFEDGIPLSRTDVQDRLADAADVV